MTAEDLKAWRKRLALSQQAASEALGCGKRTIQQYESGENRIPRYFALACAAISLGVPPIGLQPA